ncbi:Spherulation-specific family 4 [Rubripirellula amarantea]|uniref:Spherulation-specific family 4 n=1 Tax=Rubripirellula amarantea TaxID=2527999 RepID=A0A5C5WSK0_9BACT|nr:Spherulation-specific family 4 [Rubripirellula amarantea]
MTSGESRLAANQRFHLQASEKMGLLIPLYIYPANIHTNADYNRVMELKRKYSEVPFWVVLNPASGPGNAINANYTKAIDRLIGAGCVVLGYVPTGYGKTPIDNVRKDMAAWREMYPRIHGIFFDEMIYDDTASAVDHQTSLNAIARELGYWPTVANPGADTPGRYFAADAADVIVIHEADHWPTQAKLHGDYFGGYSDYPPASRATLMYGQATCDTLAIKMSQRYTRWIYVTQDTYKPGDQAHPNPWDQLSIHLEIICKALTK